LVIRFFATIVGVLLCSPRSVKAQTPGDSAAAAWVSGHALPFALDGDDPVPGLASLVARARLIGVGESVHNQPEFLALRFRLLRASVIHHRVTALVLESGLPEAIALDRWITGRSDTVDVDAALQFGFRGHAEVREAMQWLRRWNLGPGKRRPVRVYGADLPSAAGSILPALDQLVELAADDAARIAWINTVVRPLASRVSGPFWRPAIIRYDSLSPAAKDSLRSVVAELVAKTRRRSDREARLAIVAEQTETMLRLGAYHPTSPRDQAMAANTAWVLSQQSPGERVMLWAHNAHVQRVPIEGQPVPGGGPTPSMGTILRRKLGIGYVAIGTSYGGPSVDSAAAPVPGSVDGLLSGVAKTSPFLVRLQPPPVNGAARGWLETKRLMRFQVGHLSLVLGQAFDGVIFFSRVRLAEPASKDDE
jgi:erythromycin esterase